MGLHLKGDERIVGDSDLVEPVLGAEEDKIQRCYRLRMDRARKSGAF